MLIKQLQINSYNAMLSIKRVIPVWDDGLDTMFNVWFCTVHICTFGLSRIFVNVSFQRFIYREILKSKQQLNFRKMPVSGHLTLNFLPDVHFQPTWCLLSNLGYLYTHLKIGMHWCFNDCWANIIIVYGYSMYASLMIPYWLLAN